MSRITPLTPDKMDADFARYYDELARTGGRIGGPSVAYMRNPQFFRLNQAVGDAVRSSSLTPTERQIAVITTVRHFGARYAWTVQVRQALAAGVDRATIDAINDKKRPALTLPGELTAWEVADQLGSKRALDDAAYAKAMAVMGEQRLVDLIITIGFFSMVGTTLRAFEIDPPEDDPIPLKG